MKTNTLSKESVDNLFFTQLEESSLVGVYQYQNFRFALHDVKESSEDFGDKNNSLTQLRHFNLRIVSDKPVPPEIEEVFFSLVPPLTVHDAGIFIYPLGICLLFSVFVFVERFLALRRGVTFPKKVERALRNGNFPDKKWKQKSSAERIVWVAIHEKPSAESLKAYSKIEISSLERGLFILEVIVSGAPLIGLLGTVTGLVQVFSAMPSLEGGNDALAEGIGLALLTTILGLAIAIPSLLGHSYLNRIINKRSTALHWVTARIIDAVAPNRPLE